MGIYAHLPVENNTPDEPQGQLMVSIYDICPSYVYQIHLKMRVKRVKQLIQTKPQYSMLNLKLTNFKCSAVSIITLCRERNLFKLGLSELP